MVGEREYTPLAAAEPELNKFTVISRTAAETTKAVRVRDDLPDFRQPDDPAPALGLGLGLALALRLKR
ncbi:hypothetical protein [Actinocrinis sp.]|uniref:hypothetical protein n=1 Tax=Actinocrinis sp. TaxID=1920516 RepID=UPI002D2FF625|nr:hypothetical protein [Actinocrinis sp.]HZP51664.1 hypothetical protein [Actinocrinis sp.]